MTANFVSNAVKYSPGAETVIVSLKQTGQNVRVSVHDFGIGIPEGLDHKIFERYFRVNSTRRSSIPGVGPGLYISAQIIRQHGGKIYVESKEGIGSIFSFELPVKPADKSKAGVKHIVIIEDDAFILDTMSILLESEGYKVTGYSNGSVILDNELELPDLLIVDRQLPGIDGITLCRKLKSEPPTKNIPVILMSASSDIEQLAQDALWVSITL